MPYHGVFKLKECFTELKNSIKILSSQTRTTQACHELITQILIRKLGHLLLSSLMFVQLSQEACSHELDSQSATHRILF